MEMQSVTCKAMHSEQHCTQLHCLGFALTMQGSQLQPKQRSHCNLTHTHLEGDVCICAVLWDRNLSAQSLNTCEGSNVLHVRKRSTCKPPTIRAQY